MVVGALRISLIIRESYSLKDKRQILRSLKDRIKNKFNVSIAETDFQDIWQRAEIGIAAVGTDAHFVNSVLSNVVNFVREFYRVEMADFEIETY